MSRSIYEENGHRDREAYLRALARELGKPLRIVKMVADLLGPNEDFDGLVIELEDYCP